MPFPPTQRLPTSPPSTTTSPRLPTRTSPSLSSRFLATPPPQHNTPLREPVMIVIVRTSNGFVPLRFRAARTFPQENPTYNLAPSPRPLSMALPAMARSLVTRTKIAGTQISRATGSLMHRSMRGPTRKSCPASICVIILCRAVQRRWVSLVRWKVMACITATGNARSRIAIV